jgi:undecaprenyl-diphosphatase
MGPFEAIVRGTIQGITEFLPISSTAHLYLVPWLIGWEDHGLAFDTALHLGTLISLVWFFRADWIAFAWSGLNVLRGKRTGSRERLFLYIIAATFPGALAGLLLEDVVETYLRTPLVMAATLISLALLLVAAERWGRRTKDLEAISWTDAMVIGAAQALALVPGVSRSGITITAALFRDLKRETGARFSFLLSTPIIAGAAGKQSLDFVRNGTGTDQTLMLLVGIAASAVVGYLAIRFMLRYLATNTTYAFVYYRITLGIVVLLAFWSGFR